jgi:hypothetical protein
MVSVAAGFVGAGSVDVGSSGVDIGVETGPDVDCGALVLPASVRLSPHAAISINIITPTAIKVPSFAFMAYLLTLFAGITIYYETRYDFVPRSCIKI